jgi:LysR family transcriptional regulator, glycine cleavage system transcriptional activator
MQIISHTNTMRTLPYHSLRVFEAVARLQSFSQAATELGMTQSAVSQHVRALEDWTGRTLLLRGARRSAATPDGRRLAEAVSEGLGRISGVVDNMRTAGRQSTTINVACPPGFAVNWLFPRLLNFDQDHPDVPVSITTQPGFEAFETGGADVAIRYAASKPSGLHAGGLLGERIFPVCTAALAASGSGIVTVADLAHHTLLVDMHGPSRTRPPSWGFWAEMTGQTLPDKPRERRFGQSNLSVQAAIQGAGVALGREPLVIDALRSGALVMPLPYVARSKFHYWFVCPPKALECRQIQVFRDWLGREAARQSQFTPHAGQSKD